MTVKQSPAMMAEARRQNDQRIVDAIDAGLRIRDLTAKFQCGETMIRRVARRNGRTITPPEWDWSEADIATLKEDAARGVSYGEIGRRLGKTRNAIISKARSLKLDARPSPILWGVTPKRVRQPKPKPLVAEAPLPLLALLDAPVVVAPKPVFAAPEPVASAVVIQFRPVSPKRCQWLSGETPRTFVQCDDPAVSGKPYCECHCARAYVPRRSAAMAEASA